MFILQCDLEQREVICMHQQESFSIEKIKSILNKDIPAPGSAYKNLAAVHILILNNSDLDIVLTKRSTFVENHKHEISLPGGAKERVDADLYQTALRETCEEINIRKSSVHFMGCLDPFNTHYGLRIYPFISSIPEYKFMQVSPNWEVEKIFTVPLNWFLDKKNLKIKEMAVNDQPSKRQVYFFKEYQGQIIWGITAAILKNFIEVIKK